MKLRKASRDKHEFRMNVASKGVDKGMDGTCEGYLKDFKVNHSVLFLKLDRGSKFIT